MKKLWVFTLLLGALGCSQKPATAPTAKASENKPAATPVASASSPTPNVPTANRSRFQLGKSVLEKPIAPGVDLDFPFRLAMDSFIKMDNVTARSVVLALDEISMTDANQKLEASLQKAGFVKGEVTSRKRGVQTTFNKGADAIVVQQIEGRKGRPGSLSITIRVVK